VFTQTVTCQPPPPAQEDCVGSITLCTDQAVNNNTNNTGSVADLNSSNYGCLLAAEQQGTWYNFTIASGGTVGMNIVPVGPDDYDWAVWGPFPTGSTLNTICPPLGGPIRCSFASGFDSFWSTGSYTTGMGNAAYAAPAYAAPLPAYSDPVGGDGWTPGLNVVTGQVYILYISNFDNSGQAFAMDWVLGSGASLNCTVLPVEMTTREAMSVGDDVLLYWSTATEHGSGHFVIERSPDGVAFEDLTTVFAQGHSATTTEYRHIDDSPYTGVNYYRLRTVDADGAFAHSPVRSVIVQHGAGATPLFPDPVEDPVTWIMPKDRVPIEVKVIDATGRSIAVPWQFDVASGVITLTTASLPSGYFAGLALGRHGERIAASRFVKR
jgi:hypothetical protein